MEVPLVGYRQLWMEMEEGLQMQLLNNEQPSQLQVICGIQLIQQEEEMFQTAIASTLVAIAKNKQNQ